MTDKQHTVRYEDLPKQQQQVVDDINARLSSCSSPSACSVSLEPAGWQAVIENLRRGALQYEAATGHKADGMIALICQIQDQLEPNDKVSGSSAEPDC